MLCGAQHSVIGNMTIGGQIGVDLNLFVRKGLNASSDIDRVMLDSMTCMPDGLLWHYRHYLPCLCAVTAYEPHMMGGYPADSIETIVPLVI